MQIRGLVLPLLSVLLSIGWTVNSLAQRGETDIKFRLAQSYERSGDFESALKLYQELHQKDSTNAAIAEALRRLYVQLKRYDEAIVLMQSLLLVTPNDIGLLTQLASIFALKSDEPKALEVWERAIAVDTKNEITYRLVANSMTQSRLFDRAIAIYARGRSALGNSTLFTSDIAYLYSMMMNYREATREYLNLIRQNPNQLGYVQSRIAMYTGREGGLELTTHVVEEAVNNDPGNVQLHQLLAWLYMEARHFDKAYYVYKLIDAKSNASGNELYNFAERALREKAYTTAAKTFQDVIQLYPKFPHRAQAKFGYARTLEEADAAIDTLKLFGDKNPFGEKSDEEAKPRFSNAIIAYDDIIREFPSTEIAARSLLRIAILKQEKFFDLDGARSSLEILQRDYARFPSIANEARLRLGDVFFILGDLQKAESQYQMVAGKGPLINEHQERATVRLAELRYFQGLFPEALEKLKALTANPLSNATNDALSLQLFIQENMKPNDAALREFAKADLRKRQNKLSEALKYFESLVQTYPNTDIVDETLMNIGDILTQMKRYGEAIATYEKMLKDFPQSIALERTLMKMGEVYERGLYDKTKAIGSYEQLLKLYPNSIYVNEARKRIREMRGDNI
ncbi:MAG: tetratricopeptide repeat protein [Ignavibacteriae bacterium]|nr:tetratricopeptide repeat protein [Ignavibacteriota bacterium]